MLSELGETFKVLNKKRINAFSSTSSDRVMTTDDLVDRSDYELKKVCSPRHSLYHLLPPYHASNLHLQGHPFQLPEYHTDLHKKSFIVRSLYEYIK